MTAPQPRRRRWSLSALSTVLVLTLVWSPPALADPPSGIPPTITNALCSGTRLTFDIVNQNDFGVNVSVDYGPAWSGWGDFWVPPSATSGFVVDQGVSCAGALPLTVQGWGIAAVCPWPPELGRCGQPQASSWGVPVNIEMGSGDALSPQVAMDAQGNAIAVWHQFDGAWFKVWTNRFIPDVGWGEPRLLSDPIGQHDLQQQVATDGLGSATTVWRKDQRLVANRFVPGLGWGPASPVQTNPSDGEGGPQVGMDGHGNAIAVWQQQQGCCDVDIWANRFVLGTGWGTPVQIETTDTGFGQKAQLAVDPQGNAVAVWEQSAGARFDIWANRFTVGVGWGAATRIETNDLGTAEKPMVAVDNLGNAIAVWQHPNSIWANRFERGTGWGTPTLLETGSGDAFDPQVATDGQGNSLAVWKQLTGARFDIWASRHTGGSGWGVPTLVETNDVGDAQNPQVALYVGGNGIATWEQSDGTRFNIWENRFVPGGGWSVPRLVETNNTGNAGAPQVAVSASGHAVIVWQQSDGIRFNVWANHFAPDTTPPPLVLTSPVDDFVSGASVAVAGVTEPGAIVTVNGVTAVANSTGAFSVTIPLSEGPNTITVLASDGQGNTASATRSITRDSTPPSLVVATPADGAVVAASVVTVSGTVVDALSGIAELSVNGLLVVHASGSWSVTISLPEGVQTIMGTAVDRAGNTVTVIRTVTVDTQAPTLSLTAPVVQLTSETSVVVAGTTEPGAIVTVNGAAAAVNASGAFATTIPLSEGPNTITVVASDGRGNTASSRTSITRDSTPPSLDVAAPVEGATFAARVVTVSGTVADALSGVAELRLNGIRVVPDAGGRWIANLSLEDGVQTITSTAVDRAGNIATVVRTVTVDTRAPTLSITSPSLQLTRFTSVVVAGTTEPGAAITVNGAPTAVDASGGFSITITLLEGLNTITVVASDGQGNTASAATSITRDSTPPSLAVATPAMGTTFTTSLVAVSGTVADALSGIAELSVNGLRIGAGAGGTWSATLSLEDGPRTITATVVDRAGNVATVVRTVTVDTKAPILSITSPTVQFTSETSVVVAGTTEPGAVVTVNGVLVTVGATGTFSTSVTLVEGPNTITVTARDTAGNAATAAVWIRSGPDLEDDVRRARNDLSSLGFQMLLLFGLALAALALSVVRLLRPRGMPHRSAPTVAVAPPHKVEQESKERWEEL